MSEEKLIYKGHDIPIGWFKKTYRDIMLERSNIVDEEALINTVQIQIDRDKRFIDRLERTRANSGFRLTFYANERKLFPTEFSMKVEDRTAEKIVSKIARHFKFKIFRIGFRGNKGSGHAWYDEITLSHNPSIAVICHELAHSHNKQKYGNMYHNKKLLRTMTRFIEYCRKMNYWKVEL